MATTEAAVKLVLNKDYDTAAAPSVVPYIDAAGAMVARVVTCATAKGYTLSSTEQELIERWLAAHLYACSDRPFKQKATAQKSGTFDGLTGHGLDATLYGQQAMALDPSGCLRSLDQPRRKMGVAWLGKAKSDQQSYDDRNPE